MCWGYFYVMDEFWFYIMLIGWELFDCWMEVEIVFKCGFVFVL